MYFCPPMKKVAVDLKHSDVRALARSISMVENEEKGYEVFLQSLKINYSIPVIGFTGPPGAGKSTLINALLQQLSATKKIAVLAVDPTSPFSHGSLLGDRVRMNEHFKNPNVYIRSLATRGSLGGLSAKTIEITDVLRSADFDYVFVETVGVGQSEIEIAYLADTTVLILNPNAGDEIQTLKSGILEIADVYVINKSEDAKADVLKKQLLGMLHLRTHKEWNAPVIKTIATSGEGVDELIKQIEKHKQHYSSDKKLDLFCEKIFRLVQQYRMKDFDKLKLQKLLSKKINEPDFNVHRFVKENYPK